MPLRITETEDQGNHRELGLLAFTEDRWLDATEHLEQAVEDDPTDADAANALAHAYSSLGDKKKARSILGHAVENIHDSVEIYRNFAALLFDGGRILEAADSACKAVDIDPSGSELANMLERIRAQVKSIKPVSTKKAKKQNAPGFTQGEINARLADINKALRKIASVSPAPSESTAAKQTIALCMIAKNEEKYIGQCLASVKGLVDEIVVLDTGSEDRTQGIAKSHGAVVHQSEWTNNYSEARNKAISYVKSDWILVLDADECLDEGSRKLVQKAVKSGESDAYTLYFMNYTSEGDDTDYFIHRTCRLFRNKPEYRFEGRIHERIVSAIETAGGKVQDLDAVVHHYGYKPKVMEERKKLDRYLKLLHEEVKENPGDPFSLYNLGVAYSTMEDHAQASTYLGQAVESVKPTHEFAAAAYSRLAKALSASGKSEEALACLEEASNKGIKHPELEYEKGNTYIRLGQYDLAIGRFSMAIQQGKSGRWIGDPGAYGYKALYGIAQSYTLWGDISRAIVGCQQVLQVKPNDPETLELLGVIQFNLSRYAEAEKYLRRSLDVRPDHPETMSRLAQLCQSQGHYQEAAELYDKVLSSGMETGEIRFKLGLCLHAAGELKKAEENYKAAIQNGGDFKEVHTALGLLYGQQARIEDGLQCFNRSLEIDPTFSDAYFSAGDMLYLAERYIEAADLYQSGLEHQPANAQAFLHLGNCYFKMTAYDAAEIAYRQAIVLNPNYSEAANNLAAVEQAAGLSKVA